MDGQHDVRSLVSTIEHPLFGTVDLGVAGTWDATLKFAGREVELDVTLDEPSSAPAEIQARLAQLDELSLHDRVARASMAEEAKGGKETAPGLLGGPLRASTPCEVR